MLNNMFNYTPDYMDNLIEYLNSPEDFLKKINSKEKPISASSTAALERENLQENIPSLAESKKITVESGVGLYSIEKARQLIIDYLNVPKYSQSLNSQHDKIIQIYQRLIKLSGTDKSFMEGLDEKKLLSKEIPRGKLQDLDDLLQGDIFIPKPPEEQIFKLDEGEVPQTLPEDPVAQTYAFQSLQNLKVPSKKLLYHIQADEFGSGSQLQGMNQMKEVVNYLSSYIKQSQSVSNDTAKPSVFPLSLLQELNESLEIQAEGPEFEAPAKMNAILNAAQQKISQAFETRTPLLILGGWKGMPGHAIYYEIIPTSDTTATFRLYNTGAGVDYHDRVREGHKVKFQTFKEWKGIDRKNLESSHFLAALYELRTYTATDSGVITPYKQGLSPTKFGHEDIYSGLKSLLKPQDVGTGPELEVAVDKSLVMSPQRTGVCAWKSLMAFMRTKMSLNDYKRFKCDIKLQSLQDFVQAQTGTISADDWRLVLKSHQNLSRAIVNLHRQKLIGDDYVKSAQQILKPIAEWIMQHADSRFKPSIGSVDFKYLPAAGDSSVENKLTLPNPLHEALQASKEAPLMVQQPWHNLMPEFNQINLDDPQALEQNLDKLITLASKAWSKGEDHALHLALKIQVTALKLEDNFWNQAIQGDTAKAQKLITQLGELSQLFFKSCFTIPEAHLVTPEKIYVTHKILFLQQLICRNSFTDPYWKALNFFKNGFPEHSAFIISDLLLSIPNAKIQQDIQAMIANKYPSEGGRLSAFRDSLSLDVKDEPISYYSSKKIYLEDIFFKECKASLEKIALQDPTFSSKDPNEQKAILYASPDLPAWAKALRDAQIADRYLRSGQVSSMTLLDRQKDMQPAFNVRKELNRWELSSHYEVEIKLQGINEGNLKKNTGKYIKFGDDIILKKPGQYPQIQTDSIINFIKYWRNNRYSFSYEKNMVGESVHAKNKDIDMEDENFRDLSRMFFEQELRIPEALEFFSKYPEKLSEPDYQALLQSILFFPKSLGENLKITGSTERLAKFVETNYELFRAHNNITALVFILRIARQLRDFCPNQPFYDTTLDKLQTLLKLKGLETSEKNLLYTELLAQLSQKKTLNEAEVGDLLIGSIFIQENHAHIIVDPINLQQAHHALTVHADALHRSLIQGLPNQPLLNTLLATLRPTINKEYKWKINTTAEEFPSFITEDGQHQLYPLQSILISGAEGMLPPGVLNHPVFQELFPGIEYGHYLPNGVFSFKDAEGQDVVVTLKESQLVVEKKLLFSGQEGWYRYIYPNVFLTIDKDNIPQSIIGSRYMVHQFTHWESLAPQDDKSITVLAFDKNTRQPRYKFNSSKPDAQTLQKEIQEKLKADLKKLSEKRDAMGLGYHSAANKLREGAKINPKSSYLRVNEMVDLKEGTKLGKSSSVLAAIEEPAYVHEWYDSNGALKKIELPRFQLSFKIDPSKPNKLFCEQLPGYYLKSGETIRELGSFSHYLCFENEKGQRKVYIPQQTFKAPEAKEVLLPGFELERELKTTRPSPQKGLVFDRQKRGNLFHKSLGANLYLAQVLGIAQEYAKAMDYLKKLGEKTSVYTPSEAQLLKDIASIAEITGDKSGNAASIQIYADYLRMKNAYHHQSLSNEDLQALRSHYDHYLNHYRHATVNKLTPYEELFLLQILLKEQFDTSHYLRLKELNPTLASTLTQPSQETFIKPSADTLSGKTSLLIKWPSSSNEWLNMDRSPAGYTLLTRPQEAMEKNLAYYYRIARKGSESEEEKQRLRQSLPFLSSMEGGKYQGYRDFFEAILDNPSAFPESVILEGDIMKVKETFQKIIEAKAKISEAHPQEQRVVDITPKGFRLEEKPPVTSALKFSFTLPDMTSLSADSLDARCFKKLPEEDKTPQVEFLLQLLPDPHFDSTVDPVQKKEISRLRADLEQFKGQTPDPVYALKEDHLDTVREILSKDQLKDQAQLQKLEKKILELANKSPTSPEALAHFQLQSWGELRKVITLEELLMYFAKNDYTPLLQRNPALDPRDIRMLAKLAGRFLLYATRDQQRQRAETALSKMDTLSLEGKAQSPEYTQLVNQLAHEMLAERQFDPLKRPAYLVFEYFADISIRPTQKKKLETFLKNKDLNLVMEMIMGSGKSKVLLPLLGMMRADGQDLSMLIVPQALFESIAQDTQTSLQGAFSQTLRAIHFDRNTPFTVEFLENILQDLEHIRDHKECLIMTNKSVQCLLLKFIGESGLHLNGPNKDKPFPPELQLFQKIMGILSQSGYPIIDEADTVLNVLHEVNFSSGKPQSPPLQEMELLSEIYSLIYEDSAIRNLARIESDPYTDKTASVLTEQIYFEKMQRPLAEALVQRLGKMTFESKSLEDKMHAYVASLNEKDRALLLQYLCRDKDPIKEAQGYYDSLDSEIKDVIALAGEQISHLLPYTLTRICDEKYGLDLKSGDPLAIPFSGANSPSTGSQFANPHITMNYTFQMYMKNGISREMLEAQIKALRDKALREITDSGGKLSVNETEAGKAFAKLKGPIDMPLFNYKPVHLYELQRYVNSSPAAKRSYVSHVVLPQLQLFAEKISSNPHNLAGLFLHPTGFTGTLWNGLSMHHTLNPQPEIGTDAKTLALLWEHSRNNAISIKEGSSKSILQQLKDRSIEFDMISDAGGYFKEGGNKEIAHVIADTFGRPTVYYNAKGEQTISGPDEDLLLAQSNKTESERLTFLDQIHTTGADVPQKWNAVGLVTIGRNILLRDLLQSVWRLRGLNKSQRVRFLVSDEVASIIRQQLKLPEKQPIEFDAILKFALANQSAQQGLDNYKALKQELANIPQFMLLKALMHERLAPQYRTQIFELLQAQWIKPAIFTAHDLYGHLAVDQNNSKVLETEKKQCTVYLKELFTKMPWLEKIGFSQKDTLEEVEKLAARIQDSLPATIKMSPIDHDQTVEVERVAERETHTRLETNIQQDTKTEDLKEKIKISYIHSTNEDLIKLVDFKSFKDALPELLKEKRDYRFMNDIPVFPLETYLETDTALKSYANAFKGIHMALNALQWSEVNEQIALLGSFRIDFHHIMVDGDKVTMLTDNEARRFISDPNYYNLSLGFIDPKKQPTPEQLAKIVKIKFLNGESQFSKQEIEMLKAWFNSEGPDGTEKMQKLYLQHVINGYPQKIARYQNSPLQKLFASQHVL